MSERCQTTAACSRGRKVSIFCYNVCDAFARFARRAVVTLRPDSSPPFLPAVYLREIQKTNVSGFAALDVCQSVRDI